MCEKKDTLLLASSALILKYEAGHGGSEESSEGNNLQLKVDTYFEVLSRRADNYRQNKQFVQAIMTYKRAIEFEVLVRNRPLELANLCAALASCHGELENYGSQIDESSSALRYVPNYMEAFLQRACRYFKLKKYVEAKQDL